MIPWDLIIAVIVAVLGSNGLWEYLKYRSQKKDSSKAYATKAELDVVKQGQMVVIQDRLHTLITNALDHGEVNSQELKIITNLYEVYTKEGGNSFIKELYERLENVQIHK